MHSLCKLELRKYSIFKRRTERFVKHFKMV